MKVLFLLLLVFYYSIQAATCLEKNKEETLNKYYAIQRAMACEASKSFLTCNEYLGLGVLGITLGAATAASSQIRNPNFRMCPLKTYFSIFPEAYANSCVNRDLLLKEQLRSTIARTQNDLEQMYNQLQTERNSLAPKSKELLDYENEFEQANRAYYKSFESHRKWPQYASLQAEADDIRSQMRSNQTPENLNELRRKYNNLQTQISNLAKELNVDPTIRAANERASEAARRVRNFEAGEIKNETKQSPQAEQRLREIDLEEERLRDNRLRLESVRQRVLYSSQRGTLISAVDELLEMGTTSPQQRSSLNNLRSTVHFTQPSGSGLDLSVGTRMRMMNPIRSMGSKLGLAGVGIGIATASSASEIVPFAIQDATMTTSLGCGLTHFYFSFENEEGSCKPQMSLNSNNKKFFEFDDESRIEAEIRGHLYMCEFIEKTYQEYYPSQQTVRCDGDKVSIQRRGESSTVLDFETNNYQFQSGNTVYNLVVNDQLELVSGTQTQMRDSPMLGRMGLNPQNIRKSSPESLKAEYEFNKKIASFLEIKACCSNNGPKPSSEECRRHGVQSSRSKSSSSGSKGSR